MRVFAQNIVETVRHPLILLDGQLRVQSANAPFYRTFLMGPAVAEGQLLYDLDGGEWNIPQMRTLLNEVISGKSFEDFEVDYSFPRLGRRVMMLNARRVLHAEDQSAMILLAIEDVTEKVKALDAMHELNRELEARVRKRTSELEIANRELEAFCYSVSHDLRAPLRALDGFSGELLRRYGDTLDVQGKHYLERVRSGTQRMGHLIDDLLQLSRLSRGTMKQESVDLSEVANASAAELQQLDPERQVRFEIESNLFGLGDPGLLKIVVENLLNNAWKFTGKKPLATIAMGRTERDGQPAFFVRDDGAGFDMSHAEKLFGAFQRLHSQREFPGNGIGLATVQRIVHRHGGQISADSHPGQGATFTFTLPTKEHS